MSSFLKRPTVPAAFYEKSAFKTLAVCTASVLMWLIPWIAMVLLWSSGAAESWKILLSIPIGIVGAYGLMTCGWLAHDGFHFNLHSDRKTSALIGLVLSVPAYALIEIGFAVSHWNHHINTNTPSDPDLKIFGKFNSLLTRMFFARPYSFYVYGKTAFLLALEKPLPYKHRLALPEKTVRDMARLNIALCALALVLHVAMTLWLPIVGWSFTYLLLCTSLISGLNPYTEHAGVGYEAGDNARTKRGLWWDFFFMGNNYHIEHHLYPSVPYYNLKKVHAFLSDGGYYADKGHISDGLLGALQYADGKYQYATPASEDLEINPSLLLGVHT